jgi:uncharacterized glyoxalase superfamily protein PhnB
MTTASVQPIPPGFHAVTPHLVCAGAAEAIAFYQRAFGAEELSRLPGPGGRIMHAMIRIGDSVLMLVDEFPEMGAKGPASLGGTPVTLHLYVTDADAAFARAVQAGATARMPVAEQFWGDRYGIVVDPYGHQWSIATHVKDLTPEQMMEGMKAMSGGGCPEA